MLIVCPHCETTYQVKPEALGAAGRSVRCAQCKNTWLATLESAVREPEMAVAAPPRRAPAPPPPAPPPLAPEPPTVHPEPVAGDVPVEAAMPASVIPAEGEAAITVENAPPLVPQAPAGSAAETEAPKFEPGVPDQPESAAARRARQAVMKQQERRRLAKRLLSMPALIVLLLAVVLSALNWRASVVRHFPQTGSLYAAIGLGVNLRGLTFENVKSTTEFHDGVTVLIVEGLIVNLTRNTLDVPRLRLALRNASGHEVYAWTAQPPKPTLGSGNGLPFRARLASPPPDGRDVIVRFLNRRDVGVGS